MLHRNQSNNHHRLEKKKSNKNKSTSSAGDESACNISQDGISRKKISIKKKNNGESVCRVCLKEGAIQIFGNKKTEDLAESFNVFAGIKISINDPYPKYLCQPCYTLLQGAILFRKTAQQSDEILKQPSEDLPTADNDDTFNLPVNHKNSEYELKDKNIKMYHCKKCEISFDTFKEYYDHRQTEEHENKKITCPVGNNSYTELDIQKHFATIHTEDKPSEKKPLEKKPSEKKPLEKKPSEKKPSYMCDICGKQITSESYFNRHRLTHFYELPIKCSLCPYRGRFRESLKMHMRSHTGERPYQCAKCPSRFISKSNLNRHTLTHKEEYDFRCETCGRGFYTNRELKLHYKVDHTGIKDYVCDICGKAFS